MTRLLSYPWALAFGLYYYFLFQLIYLVRFGSVNTTLSIADGALSIVGLGSVLFAQYLTRRLADRRALMAIPFALALPFSLFGALGGGLLGPLAVAIYGLAPFAIALPLGFWIIERATATDASPVC